MSELKKLFPEGHLSTADLKRDITRNTSATSEFNLLEIKSANDWIEEAKSKPIPSPLLDCLWYEGELAILFADTNLGKSILAVQIADSLTNQKEIKPFSKSEKNYKVLYCDFEMSDKQFQNRYSANYQDDYFFHPNFFRAELNLDKFLKNEGLPMEEQIADEILSYIIGHQVDVVIIDNLTYIVNEIEKSKNIAPIMQKLKWINKTYSTSILILTHTPKRDLSRPLTNADINGSKFLSNFADSIFAIGKSAVNEMLRYLKQIKSRNSAYIFCSDNVAIFTIEKEHNFLCFKFQKTDDEQDHLQVRSKAEMVELDQQILDEHTKDPYLSLRKIAEKLGTNKMRVKRIIDKNPIS